MQKQTTDHHQQQLGRHSVLAAAIALALALSACGGGGGGAGDPVVPGPDPNLGKLSITSSNEWQLFCLVHNLEKVAHRSPWNS